MKTILTVSELAKKLQISTSTAYRYAETGKLPSFKLGSNLRFLECEIDDYLKKMINEQRNQADERFWKF